MGVIVAMAEAAGIPFGFIAGAMALRAHMVAKMTPTEEAEFIALWQAGWKTYRRIDVNTC